MRAMRSRLNPSREGAGPLVVTLSSSPLDLAWGHPEPVEASKGRRPACCPLHSVASLGPQALMCSSR
jgi:hypothetical protein